MNIKSIIRRFRILVIRMFADSKPALPLPDVAIVFAPHPDDEVFGCGGLMQRMVAEGRQVELIIMTGGGKSHSGCCNVNEEVLVAERRLLARRAAAIYGLAEEHIHFLNYPDGSVQSGNENTKELIHTLTTVNKTVAGKSVSVFFPHQQGEGWSDHLRTSEIAKQLCTSIFPKAKHYEYCVWFWYYNCWKIDWKHAFTVRMTDEEYAIKLRAIDAYIKPKAPCGNAWSGVLPSMFLWASKWKRELYFAVQ